MFEKFEELGDNLQKFKPFQYYFNHICFDRVQDTGININMADNKNLTLFEYVPENQMILLNNKAGELKAFKINTFESLSTKNGNNKY